MRNRRCAQYLGAGLLCLLAQATWATDYYVSNTSWGDGNDGKSATFPWKTLGKVNSFPLQPGDRVLFRVGSVWEGTLLPKNGVTYGVYNPSGASLTPSPVIRASASLGDLTWSRYKTGSNIYVADVTSKILAEKDVFGRDFPAGVGQLIYKGQRLQRARYPNASLQLGAAGAGVFGQGKNRFLRMGESMPVVEGTTQVLKLEANALPASLLPSDLVGAQVLAKNYSWTLTRYDLTELDATKTTAKLIADPLWPGAKAYPLFSGNGYWLENKLWMLDQAGEWVFDPVSKKLYVWLPAGVSPSGTDLNAAVRLHAVQANNVAKVALQGLTFGESRGDAVAINGATTSVNITGVSVPNAGGMGIALTNNGSGTGAISGSVVSDSVNDGIYLGADSTKRIDVTNNTVKNAGLGYYASSAILLGHASKATGNTIDRSSYIGMRTAKSNTVSDNLITNSCLEFDDCGGIYTRGLDYDGTSYGLPYKNDVGTTISNNFLEGALVGNARDRLDGLAGYGSAIQSEVKGIYLDDFSGAVTVDNNYVTGFDYGVMLHLARKNTVKNNTLVGNLRYQVWIQEDNPGNRVLPCDNQPNCDAINYVFGNSFNGNVMASRLPNPVVLHNSDYGNTADFATYANNVYASYWTPVFALDSMPTGLSYKTLLQWQQGNVDAGSSVFATAQAVQADSGGSSLITNGAFDLNANGWSSYRAVSPFWKQGCAGANNCVSAQPNGEAQMVNGRKQFIVNTDLSMPLSIQQGQLYLLTFDAKAANSGEHVFAVLRSSLDYTNKSNLSAVSLASSWQTYSRVLTATATLNNARLDFEFMANGEVQFDNVRLIPAYAFSGNAEPVGFYNATSAVKSFNCPISDATRCSKFVDLRTGAAVSFPLTLAAKSSKVLVLKDPVWMDPDRDGVPGDGVAAGWDRCASTPDGLSVSVSGCAVGQTPVP